MSKWKGFAALLAGTAGIARAGDPEDAPQGEPTPTPAPAPAPSEGEDGSEAAAQTVTVVQAEAIAGAAHAEGVKEGFAAAQARMKTVMSSDAGKANPQGAVVLMSNSPDMSAEAVVETLVAMGGGAKVQDGRASVGADLNTAPKPDVKPGAANDGTDGGDDYNAMWDSVQGTKDGKKVG